MENKSCVTCGKTKSLLECGCCHADVCKSCAQFLNEGTFSLMKEVPAELQHTIYCYSCYLQNVEQPLAKYNELVEQAKEIMVFNKSQGKETRFIRRNEDWIEVKDCEDEDQVIMKLAFHAVEIGCNRSGYYGSKSQTGCLSNSAFQRHGTPSESQRWPTR
jgi:hypothetical protein